MITKINASRGWIYSPSIHIIITANILGKPSIKCLKAAINNAVRKYEILNSRIMNDSDGEFYYVPKEQYTEPEIEVRDYQLSPTEFVNEQNKRLFDLESGQLIRFILVPTESYMEMNIVLHHLAGDGNSVMLLMKEIMTNLEIIDNQGGKCELEVPQMEPMQPLTPQYVSEKVKLNELISLSLDKFNKKWLDEKVIYSKEDFMEMFHDYWKNHYTQVRRIKINNGKMSVIKTICKDKGITINNMLLTMAARAFQVEKKMAVIVDCRPKGFTTMGNYASSILIEGFYDECLDFWENAKKIQKLVKYQLMDESTALLSTRITNLVEKTLVDAKYFQNIEKFKSALVKEYDETFGLGEEGLPFCISNMGNAKIGSCFGKYTLDSISIGSPLAPGIDCNLGVITINGNLVINAEYNEGTGVDYGYILDRIEEQIDNLVMEEDEMCNLEYLYV